MVKHLLLALCCLFVAERVHSQTHKPAGSLLGTVFCADTGTPCRFASIELTSASKPSKDEETDTFTSATDINGRYELHGIPAGDYFVNARMLGYVSEPRIPADSDPLKASLERVTILAAKVSSMNLNMIRAGSISGTVTYDDGGAAIDLPVQVLKQNSKGEWSVFVTNNGNGPRAMLDSLMSTDDRGRYHFGTLPPGRYTVRATLPRVSDLVSGLLNTSGSSRGRLSIFLEGQYQANDKSSVKLTGGEELTGENITIPTQGLWRLSGTANINGVLTEAVHGSISLLDTSGASDLRSADLSDGGAFLFENVLTGSYRFTVDAHCAGSNEIPAIANVPLTTAISVQGDITDLEITCTAAQQ